MRTLILLTALIVLFSFSLYAAYRLNVLSDKDKVDSAPFKRLTVISLFSWGTVFLLVFSILPPLGP